MIFEIFIFIVFVFLISIQIYFWCHILASFGISYKLRKHGILPLRMIPYMQEDEDTNRSYQ